MCIQAKLLLLLAITVVGAGATTVSFSSTPTSCSPFDATNSNCVLGDLGSFAIYGVQLTQPTNSSQPWTLTIETNYPPCNPGLGTPGCNLQDKIVTPGNLIPPAPFGAAGPLFSISDFLIHWNNTDYGVVLAQHINNGSTVDSYVAGNLYQAPNASPDLVTAGSLMIPLSLASRQNADVWLAPGGTLLGAGSVSVVSGGNGTPAEYTITDQFLAPAGFLSTGNFSIDATSYPCANGEVVGTGTFTGGASGGVPEPGTFWLSLPILALFGRELVRRKRAS
jgi:hypothetical protein